MKSEVHKCTWWSHTVRTVCSLGDNNLFDSQMFFFSYISMASGSKEKWSGCPIFKHIRDSKGGGGGINILFCDHLAKGLCGFVEYVWMDCQHWVNKYEQTARNITWMQTINAFRQGDRISFLPLWQTIYPTMIIPQRRAITLPVHSIASVS